MKPLLWRIAGCAIIAAPIVAGIIGMVGWNLKAILIAMAIVTGALASVFCALYIVHLADKCFDKAKRPPR